MQRALPNKNPSTLQWLGCRGVTVSVFVPNHNGSDVTVRHMQSHDEYAFFYEWEKSLSFRAVSITLYIIQGAVLRLKAVCQPPLKWTYHAIFEQYIVGPYLYKTCLFSFFFQNTKRIMHFSHASFRSICSFQPCFCRGLILW